MKTTFMAMIAHVKNALAFDGQDGSHINLDAPETEAANVAALVMARNKQIRVTIEWESRQEEGEKNEGDN